MSSRHLTSRDEGERGGAIKRLHAAVAERSRAHEAHESAEGTHADVEAAASVKGAEEQVSARERWLKEVDDHNDS